MSMAACVLGDPLFASASAKHGRIITDALPLIDMVSRGRWYLLLAVEKVAAVPAFIHQRGCMLIDIQGDYGQESECP
jgi:hypothetical protein